MEATIAGEGCVLLLRIFSYERPGETGSDANWLTSEVELTATRTGKFHAKTSVALRTEELETFRDQLRILKDTLSGEATLEHLEDQVGCTIRLSKGVGELDAFLKEDVGPELRTTGARTDQSYLETSVQQLDAVCEAFPVRGSPYA